MELLYLKTFIQVVKSGSYTQAAYALDYAQSSVSTHIQKLEASYGGTRLLERRGKTMKLTAAGELLFDYAEKIISLYEESHEVLETQEIKTLRIGTIETLALYELPDRLTKFKEHYPNVKVQIIPYTESIIIEKLHAKELDFGLIIDQPYQSPQMESVFIHKLEMAVVVPLNHPFTTKKYMTIHDFKDETIILTEEGCTYRAFLLNQLQRSAVPYTLSMELSSVDTIKKAISNDWGIGFLPKFVLQDQDSVVSIPFYDEKFHFYSQLIYREKSVESRVYQSFISLFK